MPLIETDYVDSKLQYPQGMLDDDIEDKLKRSRAAVRSYHPDEVSCEDSVSVSSLSERSTASPLGDGTSSSDPIDIVNGRVCLNGGDSLVPDSGLIWDSTSLEATLGPDSCQNLDSGVNLLESISEDHMIPLSSRVGKGSPLIHVKVVEVNDDTTLSGVRHKDGGHIEESVRRNDSIDFERVPSDLKPKVEVRRSRDVWKNSVVKPESDSDTDSEKSTPNLLRKGEVTFIVGSTGSKNEHSSPAYLQSPTLSQSSNEITELQEEPSPTLLNESQVPPSGKQELLQVDTSKEKQVLQLQTGSSRTESPYANLFIPGLAEGATNVDRPAAATARPRSKTSSPKVPKKPKPLPRSLGLSINKEHPSKEDLFISSLPSDFRPVRPLRSTKTHTFTPPSTVSHLNSCCCSVCFS